MHALLIKTLMTLNIFQVALKKIGIITISETRITSQLSLLNSSNLNNYSFEFNPTETSAGGTFFTLLIICHINVVIT